jgi:hypothetical protein
MESVTKYYRVAKNDIAFVRFIFEAYDGVAVLRTVHPARGIIALHQAPDRQKLAARILDELRKEIRMVDFSESLSADVDTGAFGRF